MIIRPNMIILHTEKKFFHPSPRPHRYSLGLLAFQLGSLNVCNAICRDASRALEGLLQHTVTVHMGIITVKVFATLSFACIICAISYYQFCLSRRTPAARRICVSQHTGRRNPSQRRPMGTSDQCDSCSRCRSGRLFYGKLASRCQGYLDT